jgi:hypothetical protein
VEQHRFHYQSYLLRLWREDSQSPWHASLQSTATERVYHFPHMEALFTFLLTNVAEDKVFRVPPPDSESPS